MSQSKKRKNPKPQKPPPPLRHKEASVFRMKQDAEYLGRVLADFTKLDKADNRIAAAMLDNLAVYLSLFVHETLWKRQFEQVTPHGAARDRVWTSEVKQSRHVIKFIENSNADKPIMDEYERIAKIDFSGDSESPKVAFYRGKVTNTAHNVRVMLGSRSDGTDPYPYDDVFDYLFRFLGFHGVTMDSLEAYGGKTFRNIEWDAVSCYVRWDNSLYRRSFRGVDELSSLAMLTTCQTLMNFVEMVLSSSKTDKDEGALFRIKYITYHAVLRVLENQNGLIKLKSDKRKNRILGRVHFRTIPKMRNELTHYDISSDFYPHVDLNDTMLGMTDFFHKESFRSISNQLDVSFTLLCEELNSWGMKERHAGIPFLSYIFQFIVKDEYKEAKLDLAKEISS